MSDYGGIFNTQSVLGIPTSLDGDFQACNLFTGVRSDAVKQIQQKLKDLRVPTLVADGLWGSCSEAAFMSAFGESTSADSLRKHLGIDCDSFKKSIYGRCSSPLAVAPVPSSPSPVRRVRRSVAPVETPAPAVVASPTRTRRLRTRLTTSSAEPEPQVAPISPAAQPSLPPAPSAQPSLPPAPANDMTPYVAPEPGAIVTQDDPEQAPTPWLKYGLIAGSLAVLGLGVWWWLGSNKSEAPTLPSAGGRLRPVGTIE